MCKNTGKCERIQGSVLEYREVCKNIGKCERIQGSVLEYTSCRAANPATVPVIFDCWADFLIDFWQILVNFDVQNRSKIH